MPPPMAVRLAADLRPSADGSAVRMLAYCVYVLKVASSEGHMPLLVACPCTSFIVIFLLCYILG